MRPPLLSLCMIVRDEEATLERCVESARPYVDEIVILDTGSSDGSVACAGRLGALVLHADWTHDFSAARNRCIGEARGEFILVLDGDERLQSGPHPAALRAMLQAGGCAALGVEIVDRLDGQASRRSEQVRLFRNGAGASYSGAFREQVACAAGPGPLRASGLVVGHEGYLTGERCARAPRNAEVLERLLRQDAGDTASRFFFVWEQVPTRAGRVLPGAHRLGALEHFESMAGSACALPGAWPVEAARLHAGVLLAAGRALEAIEVLDRGGDNGVGCELLRADAELACGGSDPSAAERALERIRSCFDRQTRERGVFAEPDLSGPVARARAAEALLQLGRLGEARRMAEEAVALPGGGAAPWNVCAAVERAEGHPAEATRAHLQGLRLDPFDPWAWAGIGELLLAGGDPAEAVDPLAHAVSLAPGWDAAEEALATALLLEGRSDDVLAVFGEAQRTAGAAAHAAMILASAALGHPMPFDRVDPATPGSVQRILAKVAAAGRPDLLHNLAMGLRAI